MDFPVSCSQFPSPDFNVGITGYVKSQEVSKTLCQGGGGKYSIVKDI